MSNWKPKTKQPYIKQNGEPHIGRPTQRKLSVEQVRALRNGERNYQEVAKEAGVSVQATWFALKGYSYKGAGEDV